MKTNAPHAPAAQSSRNSQTGSASDGPISCDVVLRDQEERLRLALDTAGMGTFVWYIPEDRGDPDARTLSLFGRSADCSLDLKTVLTACLHPEDAPGYANAIQQACDPAGNGTLRQEVRVHHPDGSLHWLSITGQTYFEGTPPCAMRMVGMVQDITGRKVQERHAALLADITAELYSARTSSEIMESASAKVLKHLGLSRCAFVEIDDSACLANVLHDFRAGPMPAVKGTWNLSNFHTAEELAELRAGRPIVIHNVLAAPRSFDAAGRFAQLRINALVTAPYVWHGQWRFALSAVSTQPRHWTEDEVQLLQEISIRVWTQIDRANVEEALAADLRDTQLLRDLGARLVTEADVQTLYDEVLAAAMKLTHADAGSVQILDADARALLLLSTHGFPADATVRFRSVDASSATSCGFALMTGQRTVIDFDDPALEDSKGDLRWHVRAGYLSAQSTPLIARSGRPIGMISTHWRKHRRPTEHEFRFLDLLARQAADLIEQRQAEQALRHSRDEAEQALQVKDRFLAILSHELRTPLTPLLMGVEYLLEEEGLSSHVLETLEMLRRNVLLESRLIDDLLDVTRASRGIMEVIRAPMDFHESVQHAIEVCRSEAEAKKHHLTVALDAARCQMDGDHARLQQVVWNLLKNACKFTPAGGQIHLRTSNRSENILLEVRDSGIGFSADAVDKIFEPFTQASTDIMRRFGGLGLGLAISKAAVLAHGGEITATSEGTGNGATFRVVLPLASPFH